MIGAVVFDVGECLVDESREYGTWADWLGVPRHVFSAVFGAVIARGQDYRETFRVFQPGFDLDKARQQRADEGRPEWFGDEDQIPDVLKSERLGHDEPGMRGHVSPTMREELKAALQARWEQSLRQRAALSPESAVPVLNRLLSTIRPTEKPVQLEARTGRRQRRFRR
jgi:hypothetical protein